MRNHSFFLPNCTELDMFGNTWKRYLKRQPSFVFT